MIIKRVDSVTELEGIKNLQQENLKANLSDEESNAEGFVTAEYTLDFLKIMHEAEPSIIAKDGDVIAGYALVAVRTIASQHELLDHLFSTIDDNPCTSSPRSCKKVRFGWQPKSTGRRPMLLGTERNLDFC